MFLKLFKYDFKSVITKIVFYYIILIAVAIFAKIIDTILANTQFASLSTLPSLLYNFIMLSGVMVALVLCMIRYYKNMLSDQGYLTHTLPVKRSQILLSKLLVTLVIEAITIAVMILSLLIYSIDAFPEILKSIGQLLRDMTLSVNNMQVAGIVILILLILVISQVFNVAQISLCLTLGATHNRNKLLMAFVYYIAIYAVLQVLYVVIGIVGIIIFTNVFIEFTIGLIYLILSLIGVGQIILIVISYIVNLLVLNKKLNLE